jgi:hypothetical protein
MDAHHGSSTAVETLPSIKRVESQPTCYDGFIKEMQSAGVPKNKSFLKPKLEEKPPMTKKDIEKQKELEEKRHQKKLN